MQYIGCSKAAEKHISAKTFKENLHTSVKFLQICLDLQDSVQRSLQNPAEKSCRSAQIRKDQKPGKSLLHVNFLIFAELSKNSVLFCFPPTTKIFENNIP